MNKEKNNLSPGNGKVKLIVLDSGHFHAALLQKTNYPQIDTTVYVYAPAGSDVDNYLGLVNSYNSRNENPTRWEEVVYTANDYLEKMIEEKKGNLVIISGNNERKTEYIYSAVNAGFNVLADKPMAIDSSNFELLKKAYKTAEEKGVLIYDIMTERSEITAELQKEISGIPEIFGELKKGSAKEPAIIEESTHHFYKYVSGNVLKRPTWFFDENQQGDGITDITTHLVDLVEWKCFSEKRLNYENDVDVVFGKHWSTEITKQEFETITGLGEFPPYLEKNVKGNKLNVFSNGEIHFLIRGIYAKVVSVWNYKAPEGAADYSYSLMRGTKCDLEILQGKDDNYKPVLYIKPVPGSDLTLFEKKLKLKFELIENKYNGISLKKTQDRWKMGIPDSLREGHEAHFARVVERFLQYLSDKKLPEWEKQAILTKYSITTEALKLSLE